MKSSCQVSFLFICLSSNGSNICERLSFLYWLLWYLCKKKSQLYILGSLSGLLFCSMVIWIYLQDKHVICELRQFYFYFPNFRHFIHIYVHFFFLLYSKSRPSGTILTRIANILVSFFLFFFFAIFGEKVHFSQGVMLATNLS